MLTPELRKQIESCNNLPSPPGVATKIIRLANDPDADMARIAEVLALDPAITAKILRIANSPMYARQRKTENLRQALMVVGLNATISLALSFSLLKSWQKRSVAGGLDYPLYWRRALLAATASHVLARAIGVKDGEELFLACLIQDIGLMALDHSVPGLYEGLGHEQIHQSSLIARETERLGVDHAAVSGWLLEKWQFPERTQQVVAASHDPERLPKQSPNGVFARCVALASSIAEVFLDNREDRSFAELAERAHASFAMDKGVLGELLAEIGKMIPDAESIFDTKILSAAESDEILEQARDALMVRNLQAMQIVDSLKIATESLERPDATARGVEQARPAHELVQPRVPRSVHPGRVSGQREGRHAAQRRIRGSRPLQDGQRYVRPRDGRSGPRYDREHSQGQRACRGRRRALRRRGVHARVPAYGLRAC